MLDNKVESVLRGLNNNGDANGVCDDVQMGAKTRNWKIIHSELWLLKEDVEEAYDKGVLKNHIFKDITGFLGVTTTQDNGQSYRDPKANKERT